MKIRNKSVMASLLATSLIGGVVAAPQLLAPPQAVAQNKATVGTLLAGLINANVQAITGDILSDINVNINTGDIDVLSNNVVTIGDVTLVNVENVLNNAQIDILNNAINNNNIANGIQIILTDVLNDSLNDVIDANVLNVVLQGLGINVAVEDVDALVVVGVLGGVLYVLPVDLPNV